MILKIRTTYTTLLWGCILLFSFHNTQAQLPTEGVPYKYILLEEFTGSWCNNCPAATKALDALLKEGCQIAPIAYQIAEMGYYQYLYNLSGWNRSHYYGTVRSIPSMFVNGSKSEGTNHYKADYLAAIKEKTPYTLSLKVQHFRLNDQEKDSFQVKVTIERVAQHPGKNIRLYVALTQDSIPKIWYDQTELKHVTRKMYPNNGEGSLLDFSSNNQQELSYNFTLPYSQRFLIKNSHIIAFIQDSSIVGQDTSYGEITPIISRKVLQTDMLSFHSGDFTILPKGSQAGFTDFQNWDLEIPVGDSACFFDNTLGEANSYQWVFEGGTPSTSTQKNPIITYKKAGSYKVTLSTVSNGQSRTYYREHAVDVLPLYPTYHIDNPYIGVNRYVRFNLTSLADSCFWTFPGGTPYKSTDTATSVKYGDTGSYNVMLSTVFYAPRTGRRFTYKITDIAVVHVGEKRTNEELSHAVDIKVYADPSCLGCFRIEAPFDIQQVTIFNAYGQKISVQNGNTFHLYDQARGIYILSISPTKSKKAYSSFTNPLIKKFIW
ncbi:MAG: PKD domain-containing protein [Bacteroidales bacterium]